MAKTSEKRKAYNRAYYLAHKDRILADHKEELVNDKGKVQERRRRFYQEHKEEIKAKQRDYYAENRDKCVAYQRVYKYGLSPEEFDAMVQEQDGACAICQLVSDRTLHVDHDHDTGAVRGLLCTDCNLSIGRMRDDPQRLIAAANYLQAHGR